jgi:hypothetical protein
MFLQRRPLQGFVSEAIEERIRVLLNADLSAPAELQRRVVFASSPAICDAIRNQPMLEKRKHLDPQKRRFVAPSSDFQTNILHRKSLFGSSGKENTGAVPHEIIRKSLQNQQQ